MPENLHDPPGNAADIEEEETQCRQTSSVGVILCVAVWWWRGFRPGRGSEGQGQRARQGGREQATTQRKEGSMRAPSRPGQAHRHRARRPAAHKPTRPHHDPTASLTGPTATAGRRNTGSLTALTSPGPPTKGVAPTSHTATRGRPTVSTPATQRRPARPNHRPSPSATGGHPPPANRYAVRHSGRPLAPAGAGSSLRGGPIRGATPADGDNVRGDNYGAWIGGAGAPTPVDNSQR